MRQQNSSTQTNERVRQEEVLRNNKEQFALTFVHCSLIKKFEYRLVYSEGLFINVSRKYLWQHYFK